MAGPDAPFLRSPQYVECSQAVRMRLVESHVFRTASTENPLSYAETTVRSERACRHAK